MSSFFVKLPLEVRCILNYISNALVTPTVRKRQRPYQVLNYYQDVLSLT